MNLLVLSFKNATVKWWRSLTLGFFIFSISFIMVLSDSVITAAKNKVENVITNGITGHVQIRSNQSMEGDMVVQYSQGWDALESLNPTIVNTISEIMRKEYPDATVRYLDRISAYLKAGDTKYETMLLGIDPNMEAYKDAFLLKEGRYLDPEATDEILLTEEQTNGLNLQIGDRICVTTKNKFGLNSTNDLKIVGVGNYVMLSLFSYNANYTSREAVKKLSGMKAGEATDVILFLPENASPKSVMYTLSAELDQRGIVNELTVNEVLKSDDLKVSNLSFEERDEKAGVKISGSDDMGKTFKGISDAMFLLMNILVVFLMIIVSILIFNLVYMTGIERYRDIGTLRAIGFSRAQVIKVFMGEILSVCLLSAFMGMIVCTGFVFFLNRLGISSPIAAFDYIMGSTVTLETDIKSILGNILIISGFSCAASFYPAYKACSINPAESMRTS